MKLEFGLRQGLAVDFGYDQRINDLRYQQQMRRQAGIENEARAKMLADDLAYNTPMNEHDNPLVKQYAQDTIKKIGKFVNENPGWESNVGQRMVYNQLTRDLKDNKELNRGMITDKNMELFNKYKADAKNNEMINTDEWRNLEIERDNYLKYGNQKGKEAAEKEGKKAFEFYAPEEAVDLNPYLVQMAAATKQNGYKAKGYLGHRIFVDEVDKTNTVNDVLNSKMGRYARKEYDNYVKQNEGKEVETIESWMLNRMNPFFKSDQINEGQQPPIQKIPTKFGSGASADGINNIFQQGLSHMEKQKLPYADFGADAMQEAIANKDGEINFSNTIGPDGKMINLGFQQGVATGVIKKRVLANNQSSYYAETKTRMRIGDFEKRFDKGAFSAADIVDRGGFVGAQAFSSANTDKNWDIHDKYKETYKKFIDPKTKEEYVEFVSDVLIDPNNPGLNQRYGVAHKLTGIKNTYDTPQDELNSLQEKAQSVGAILVKDNETGGYAFKRGESYFDLNGNPLQ
jgi:hypothetical protein